MRATPVRSAPHDRSSFLADATRQGRRSLPDEPIRRQRPVDPVSASRPIPAAALLSVTLIAIAVLLILVLLPVALGAAGSIAARAG